MTEKKTAPALRQSKERTNTGQLSGLIPIILSLCCVPPPPCYAGDTTSTITLRQAIDPDYYNAHIWDDGKAEVARYRATRVIYGKPRLHEVTMITVSEDFDTATYTKAEPPYGETVVLPVMKLAVIATINTPNYPYHYMTTSFIDRSDPVSPLKLSTSSQEWCGTTSRNFERWTETPRERFQSYWQNEGAGERAVALRPGDLFEEDLPAVLRSLKFKDGLRATFRLASNVTVVRTPPITIVPAVLAVAEENKQWLVRIDTADGRVLRIRFDPARNDVLQSLEHSDGRTLELSAVARTAYWLRGETEAPNSSP